MGDEEHPAVEAKYTNLFRVGYNAFEVLVEFGQSYPGTDPDLIHSRIATSPTYARAFLKMLTRSIEGYERDYGSMRDATNG